MAMKTKTFTASTQAEVNRLRDAWIASHPGLTILSDGMQSSHTPKSRFAPKSEGHKSEWEVNIEYEGGH